jgi:23S rRNA (cytosine1962-C5)-methyltransferase
VQAGGGDVVRVVDERARIVGRAFYSDRSQISLRLLSRNDERIDTAWWRRRLETAIRYRATLGIEASAYRLVHAESDLLPSIVVDRYGEYLVVQTLSQGAERQQSMLTPLLVELMRPSGILARNDARVRVLEGLDRRTDVLYGEVPQVVRVREGRIEYDADLRGGQKTGLFLDQRENRVAASTYAHGAALDCFSYNGGFALHVAPVVDRVVAIDSSEEAVRTIVRNAALNGAANVEARVANVFDALRESERAGDRFDTIVLDPPAFAKHKSALPKARAGYKEINLRALKILNPGGFLITCTCSYHVDEATFGEIVYEAAADAGATVVVVEKRMQARDHPVVLGVPESYYLKCLILRKVG